MSSIIWNTNAEAVFTPQVSQQGINSGGPNTTSGIGAIPANPHRKSILIQNTGTNALYISFTNIVPSASAYDIVLRAGVANDDGTGGSLYTDGYTGIVSIGGTTPRYGVLEL